METHYKASMCSSIVWLTTCEGCERARVLTEGLCSGGARSWEVLCEVNIAHVAAAAAEVVRPVLDLWREVGHHAAVIPATLVVAQVSPAT